MSTGRYIAMAVVLLGAVCLGRWPLLSAQNAYRPARPALVHVADHSHLADPNEPLLELVRRRLPVRIETGRFQTDDGVTESCVSTRGSAPQRLADATRFLPACPMITAFVDGILIRDAAAYLQHTRLRDVETVELLSAREANLRFSLPEASDLLVIRTRAVEQRRIAETDHGAL